MPAPTPDQRLAEADPPLTPVIMYQEWRHLRFLHWRIPATQIQSRLPAGLHVDTFDGSAWLGIVPFKMARVRPRFLPCVPGLSDFLELNLRTYVYDDQGRPGVWFFSLDANQALAVLIARKAFNLPYEVAAMQSLKSQGELIYQSRRKSDSVEQSFRYPLQPTNAQISSPDTLEFFLLERYRLFAETKSGQIISGQVHHEPYEFAPCEVPAYSTRLFELNGFEAPSNPPESVLLANPVKVQIHPMG